MAEAHAVESSAHDLRKRQRGNSNARFGFATRNPRYFTEKLACAMRRFYFPRGQENFGGSAMGQSNLIRPIALIVEDQASQRAVLSVLLEESQYVVMECQSAEAAELVLRELGQRLTLLITDVNLAGRMSGVELAFVARQHNQDLDIIVTSGRPLSQPLPNGAKFWAKPWTPVDVLREAAMLQVAAPAR
jgi:CheY-like chemotaxis protein